MKNKNSFSAIILAICLLSLTSLISQHDNLLNNAHWLVGTWANQTERGSIYESWKVVNPKELAGKSYALNGSDTIVFETIKIIEEQNMLFYIPIVQGQNNNDPVRFKLKSSTKDVLVFENKAHDFPQNIAYTRLSADSLVAEISGMNEGKLRKVHFPMKRIN